MHQSNHTSTNTFTKATTKVSPSMGTITTKTITSAFKRTKVKPSFTAMAQAQIRYLGTKNPKPCKTGDGLGQCFVDFPYSLFGKSRHLRKLLIWYLEVKFPGGYGYSCVRSMIGDNQFRSFGGDQIVNLGAGFCTRPERFSHCLDDKKQVVFELDLAPTQTKKTKLMKKHAPTGYDKTQYCSIDFENQSIEDVLVNDEKTAYCKDAKTLFLWEGVSMYLDEGAVDAVFAFVRNNSAIGSLIVFDFCPLDYIKSKGKALGHYGGDTIYQTCANKGEPLTFGIPKDGYQDWLKQRGFSAIQFWDQQSVENEFLTDPDDTNVMYFPCTTTACICVARLEEQF